MRLNGWRKWACAAALAVSLAGCGAGAEPAPIPTPMDRAVKVDQAATPPGVVSYITERGSPAHDGSVEDAVEVRTSADLQKLRGAPEDFKAFIADQLSERAIRGAAALAARRRTLATEGCDHAVELRVWGIAENVATGRERVCGLPSTDVIWGKRDGAWKPVARMQGGWDGAELDYYRVPADITAAVCWYDEVRTRAYDGPLS